MGLDMYLRGERYFYHWSDETGDKKLSENIGLLAGLPINTVVKSLTIEAGYWRKANHIHKWFVDNVQAGEDDCNASPVSRESLTALREICQQVLNEHDLAPILLPTMSGFFFGSTEYGIDYFDDVENTIKIIDGALALPKGWDFSYESSW